MPNVVLIVIDTLRKDCVRAYGPTAGRDWFGTDVRTPTLDNLAGESLVLTRAYPEALPTVPFRRAIHTGRRCFPFADYSPTKWDIVYMPGWQPIGEDQATLAETMARAGYHTAYISDCTPMFQPSTNFHRGFQTWEHIRGHGNDRYQPLAKIRGRDISQHFVNERYAAQAGPVVRQHLANTIDRRVSEEDYFAPLVFRSASNWLEVHQDDPTPFFMMIDCWDPHEPWDPPAYYRNLYDAEGCETEPIHPMYARFDWCTDREMRRLRANYCGEVTMTDRWLGRFLDTLERLGHADDTIVAITSDHGHTIGDRGCTGKLPEFQHPELVELVTMLRGPGIQAGTHDGFAYNIDLVTTLAELAGVELDTEGVSLLGSQRRDHVTCGFMNWATYRDSDWTLMQHFDGPGIGPTKLFDVRTDPGELTDVAGERPDVVAELWKKVLADAGTDTLPTYQAPTTYADGSIAKP